MKFFHVYNEEYFDGLVKNNLINQGTVINTIQKRTCRAERENFKFRLSA